jgi:hypothetical protein
VVIKKPINTAGSSSALIIANSDKREAVETVELACEVFDELNREVLNQKSFGFKPYPDRTEKRTLEIRDSGDSGALPLFSFKAEIATEKDKATWVFRGNGPNGLVKLSPLTPYLTDGRRSWNGFIDEQKKIKTIKKYLEELADVLKAYHDAEKRIEALGASISGDNERRAFRASFEDSLKFLGTARPLLTADMPDGVSEWAGKLVCVFRCQDRHGVFFVVLCNHDEKEFKEVELWLRGHLGAAVYQKDYSSVPSGGSPSASAVAQ